MRMWEVLQRFFGLFDKHELFLLKSSTLGGTTSSLTRPQNNNWKWKNNHAVRAARTLANFPTVLSRIK